MLLSKCGVCDSTKLKFIKEQEANGLLSGLGINTPLNIFYYSDNKGEEIVGKFYGKELIARYRSKRI